MSRFPSIPFRPFPRISRALQRHARDESGAIIVLGLIIFVLMLMVGGFAVDTMRYENDRVRLQGTSDRAVLAAASLMNNNTTMSPEELAQAYFEAEGLGAYSQGRISVSGNNESGRVVTVAPEASMDTMFLRLGGVSGLGVSAPAAAGEGLDKLTLEVALVLDVSTSMDDSAMMPTLRAAAERFSRSLADGRPEESLALSIVPYSTQVWLPEGWLDHFTNVGPSPAPVVENDWCHDWVDITNVVDSLNAPMFRQNCIVRPAPDYIMARVSPFVDSHADAVDAIAQLSRYGQTHIDLGIRTAAMLLDPSIRPITSALVASGDLDARFQAYPADWTDDRATKAIVVMTDGENCCFNEGYYWNRYATRAEMDAATIATCDAIKAQGVIIYSVAFAAPQAGIDVMQACASSPGHFFNSTIDDLVYSFEAIATHIRTTSLRLVH
ncbi:TadE/TadG family type IV pilus assembly protein [Roseibaca sp. Y0-43]|uniref:TadE/TadG family type IV pilus assembly protein n=1 Tax=Roseibaca sp. Y0-43 TaxID=2816854 RepID=UPI001D0C7246|nr:TadE/TadG family type IV pilus assembly protein [Roseibaca sp. Y0-43]MCC1482314.1 pilus assembly protein [Roseibaca sp. Y0-43]